LFTALAAANIDLSICLSSREGEHFTEPPHVCDSRRQRKTQLPSHYLEQTGNRFGTFWLFPLSISLFFTLFSSSQAAQKVRGPSIHCRLMYASTRAMNVLLVNISAGKNGNKTNGFDVGRRHYSCHSYSVQHPLWVAPLSHPKASFSDVN
jgi:hypothetical protein